MTGLMVLGGALKGLGGGMVEEARAKRAAALQQLERQWALDDRQAEQQYRTSEREASQAFSTGQNELARTDRNSQWQAEHDLRTRDADRRDAAGDETFVGADGSTYIRRGSQVVPVTGAEGETFQQYREPGARPLTADERTRWGIPAEDSRPYAMVKGKPEVIGGSGQTINVGSGEKEFAKESGKLFAKRYDDLTAAASNSASMLSMLDLAEQGMNTDVRTGVGAETELNFRRLGAALGMDVDLDKMAGGELIRAVQNRMALLMRSPDGGMGMPGALSDRDIAFLKDSQIGIDRTPAGNRAMLEAFRRMERRKIDFARLADDYVEQHGELNAGFNRMVREYAEANPIFSDDLFSTSGQGSSGRTGRGIQWSIEQ